MPKLKPETQLARREHILDAAERCFAKAGFHRTTMQDICKTAHVSAGALYVHFDSKEALIAGLCQRNRAKLTDDIGRLAAAPDLMSALAALGTHYTIEEPQHKRVLHVEIGAESTRNAQVAANFISVDRFVREQFELLFARASEQGRIEPSVPPKQLAAVLCVIGDGLFWRRAVDPDFDANAIIPVLTAMIAGLVNPVVERPSPTSATAEPSSPNRASRGSPS